LVFEDLREIQRQFGYIPAEQLRTLAKKIDVPLSRLHSVASFYPHFRLTPPPKVDVRVCQDMSCHLRQACSLRSSLDDAFPQANSPDVRVSGVSCLGRCDEGPAVSINDRIYGAMTEERVMVMIGDARRPGTRRKPPAGTVSEPPSGPRTAHGRSPSSRLARLCPVRNPTTAVTTPPAGDPLLRRHAPRPERVDCTIDPLYGMRGRPDRPCAVTMASARHLQC